MHERGLGTRLYMVNVCPPWPTTSLTSVFANLVNYQTAVTDDGSKLLHDVGLVLPVDLMNILLFIYLFIII